MVLEGLLKEYKDLGQGGKSGFTSLSEYKTSVGRGFSAPDVIVWQGYGDPYSKNPIEDEVKRERALTAAEIWKLWAEGFGVYPLVITSGAECRDRRYDAEKGRSYFLEGLEISKYRGNVEPEIELETESVASSHHPVNSLKIVNSKGIIRKNKYGDFQAIFCTSPCGHMSRALWCWKHVFRRLYGASVFGVHPDFSVLDGKEDFLEQEKLSWKKVRLAEYVLPRNLEFRLFGTKFRGMNRMFPGMEVAVMEYNSTRNQLLSYPARDTLVRTYE